MLVQVRVQKKLVASSPMPQPHIRLSLGQKAAASRLWQAQAAHVRRFIDVAARLFAGGLLAGWER